MFQRGRLWFGLGFHVLIEFIANPKSDNNAPTPNNNVRNRVFRKAKVIIFTLFPEKFPLSPIPVRARMRLCVPANGIVRCCTSFTMPLVIVIALVCFDNSARYPNQNGKTHSLNYIQHKICTKTTINFPPYLFHCLNSAFRVHVFYESPNISGIGIKHLS